MYEVEKRWGTGEKAEGHWFMNTLNTFTFPAPVAGSLNGLKKDPVILVTYYLPTGNRVYIALMWSNGRFKLSVSPLLPGHSHALCVSVHQYEMYGNFDSAGFHLNWIWLPLNEFWLHLTVMYNHCSLYHYAEWSNGLSTSYILTVCGFWWSDLDENQQNDASFCWQTYLLPVSSPEKFHHLFLFSISSTSAVSFHQIDFDLCRGIAWSIVMSQGTSWPAPGSEKVCGQYEKSTSVTFALQK